MFAIEREGITPDILVLGKGLTGGYLPLAITLTTEELFARFDGSVADGKALAYGHSYTGSALGCAAAIASLALFQRDQVLDRLRPKIQQMTTELKRIGQLPIVAEVRQCGFIAGIELRDPGAPGSGSGLASQICLIARQHGLLTRPIRNVIVLMPPLCIEPEQLNAAINALERSIQEVCESVAA